MNETVYLVVITYADGSNYTYEALTRDAAESFIDSYDDLYDSYEIYEAHLVKHDLYR